MLCKAMRSRVPKLSAEVERVIRLSSGRWSSGIQKGEKVRVSYTIPVKFATK